ncbi:MAG: glycerol-3-phosphate 1-O-acyltransferase PlsY [Acidobacteria bacterium]|nr:glycerol-3-phosphate 1-O-acyltransferase PlsY [Acidobacteriota bacterium]
MTLFCLLLAFALGGIPFSHLIARLRGVDLRSVGSGNVGATNLARAAGYGAGALGLILDAAKGAAAVLVVRGLPGDGATPANQALAAALAVAGHAFTPWLRFRGGKGVATGAGAFAVLAPLATLCALLIFGVVVAVGRMVSLASVIAALALPLASHLLGAARPVTLAAVAVAALVLLRHRDNLVRMVRGTEHRLGARGGA